MNILYYKEPKSVIGGVANVAYYLPKALAKKVNVTYFPSFMPKKSYLVNLFDVYRKFAMKKFDIIHFNFAPTRLNGSYMLLKYAKRMGSHTILNIHGIIQLEHDVEPSLGPIPTKALSNTLNSCKVVDRIVVNSEYMRTNVVAWYGVEDDKIVVIPNGVDLRKFNECDDELVLDGDPAILYLGGLLRMKGVDVLIEAIAKLRSELPDMKLHLVGPGCVSAFQLLAKEKEIEKFVVFHGPVPYSAVPRYYKSADICVFPSRHEAFGLVILEAMASGTPIVASDAGGIPEIISNGENGILFRSEDADALSKAILNLYRDSGLRRKISQSALKTVIKYSWENIAQKYVTLYKQLLE